MQCFISKIIVVITQLIFDINHIEFPSEAVMTEIQSKHITYMKIVRQDVLFRQIFRNRNLIETRFTVFYRSVRRLVNRIEIQAVILHRDPESLRELPYKKRWCNTH